MEGTYGIYYPYTGPLYGNNNIYTRILVLVNGSYAQAVGVIITTFAVLVIIIIITAIII